MAFKYDTVFWKDLGERLVATEAQAALGLWTADALTNFDGKVWLVTLAVAGGAVVLKSLVAGKVVDNSMSPASLVTADPDDLP